MYLNIVNRESSSKVYPLVVSIDGKAEEFYHGGCAIPQMGNIQLKPGEKWEGEVGLDPMHPGSNQTNRFPVIQGWRAKT